jgi:uncharacterized protein (TIGR03083 family)
MAPTDLTGAPVADLADAAISEALAFAELLDGITPDQRTAPTPCTDWTVADLAAHVAAGLFRDAEAFHRARVGSAVPPTKLDLDGSVALTAVIRSAADHLSGAVRKLASDPGIVVPLPFGRYAVADALRCLIIEFGVHTDDLAIALGSRQPLLSSATVAALFGFGELYLLMQAQPLESDAVTLSLAAPSKAMSITWTGTRWRRGAGAARECRIAGSDDAIARLMLRRIDVTDPRIDVLDPARLAPAITSAIRPL